MFRMKYLSLAIVGLLIGSPCLAQVFEVGDFAFPKTTPGSIKVGDTVVDEVEISDYLIVSKVEGAWLWVECRDLLAPGDEGKKGWIAASACDDIETQINYFDGRGQETQSAGAYFLAGAVAALPEDDLESTRRALNYFTRAIELDPSMSYYHQRRASCHVMLGDYQSAITDLEEAGRLDPSNTAVPGLITQVRDLLNSGGGGAPALDLPPPTAPLEVGPSDPGIVTPPVDVPPVDVPPAGGDAVPPAGGAPAPGEPDPRLRPILLQTEFNFTINDDGNYKIILDVGGGRTQVLFVESNTEMLGTFEIREVWSPIGQTTESTFPANIADRLLRVGSTLKIGAVEVVSFDGNPTAYFSAKIPPDLDAVELTKVINAVATTADENENSLFGGDTY